ncbi:MAG: hypothetical protein QXS54_04455 [Candidatus Methanomethylicaceae archaeon]
MAMYINYEEYEPDDYVLCAYDNCNTIATIGCDICESVGVCQECYDSHDGCCPECYMRV